MLIREQGSQNTALSQVFLLRSGVTRVVRTGPDEKDPNCKNDKNNHFSILRKNLKKINLQKYPEFYDWIRLLNLSSKKFLTKCGPHRFETSSMLIELN